MNSAASEREGKPEGEWFSQHLLGCLSPAHVADSSGEAPQRTDRSKVGNPAVELRCFGDTALAFPISLFGAPTLELRLAPKHSAGKLVVARVRFRSGESETDYGEVSISSRPDTDVARLRLEGSDELDGTLLIALHGPAEFVLDHLLVKCRRTFNRLFAESYQSPETGEPLRLSARGDQLVSDDGSARYPIVNGMACFASGGAPATSDNFIRHNRYARFMQMLHALPSDALAIDIGAGYTWTKHRRMLCYDVQHFPITDALGEGLRFPFRDDTFSMAYCQQVLEHVTDPRAFATEVHRILRPGGKVFLTAAFMQGLHGFPFHYCNHTRNGLREVMGSFREIECAPSHDQKAWRALWNILGLYTKHLSPSLKDELLGMRVGDLIRELSREAERSRFADLGNEALHDTLASAFTFIGEKHEE